MSGGQQQRVGLARALAADPPILLMDEPFGALDPVTRVSIRKDLVKLEEFKKKTIVLVTHDVQEAFELGDRICLMNKGEIVQAGSAAELLFKPANDFVHSFLQEQRFTLELQSIPLDKIVDHLPAAETGLDAVSIDLRTSLWAALQLLSSSDSTIDIRIERDNDIIFKKLTTETLLASYTRFKKDFS